MKKLSFLLISLLAVTLFTACNNDDPVNKQTVTMTISNRAIDGDEVVFSQTSANAELDYTNMIIKFSASYKDADGMSHSFSTPEMKLNGSTSNTVYTFSNTAPSASAGIEQLTGYIDFATGMMWYSFDAGSSHVVSSTNLLYAYITTTVTNPDNNNHFNHQQSAYLFIPDSKGETCSMLISNFIPNIAGSVEVSEIRYDGLTLTPTVNGYTITASEIEPANIKGHYKITDLEVTLNSQCRIIDGTFECGDLDFRIAGNLFPSTSL